MTKRGRGGLPGPRTSAHFATHPRSTRARTSPSTQPANDGGISYGFEHRSGEPRHVIRAFNRRTLEFIKNQAVKIHSIPYVRHQRVAKRVVLQGDVLPEMHMPADKARHELVFPSTLALHTGASHGIRRSGPCVGSRVTSATNRHPPGAAGKAPVRAHSYSSAPSGGLGRRMGRTCAWRRSRCWSQTSATSYTTT